MDIDANQRRWPVCEQSRASLFENLAAGGFRDFRIAGFDVPSRQQPSVEPGMVDQQDSVAFRVQHQPGGGNVAGLELIA